MAHKKEGKQKYVGCCVHVFVCAKWSLLYMCGTGNETVSSSKVRVCVWMCHKSSTGINSSLSHQYQHQHSKQPAAIGCVNEQMLLDKRTNRKREIRKLNFCYVILFSSVSLSLADRRILKPRSQIAQIIDDMPAMLLAMHGILNSVHDVGNLLFFSFIAFLPLLVSILPFSVAISFALYLLHHSLLALHNFYLPHICLWTPWSLCGTPGHIDVKYMIRNSQRNNQAADVWCTLQFAPNLINFDSSKNT